MTPDSATVRALAEDFDPECIRDMRRTAVKVKMEGGTVTRSYEGSSFTIDRSNCEQTIADTTAALAALAASDLGDDPTLTKQSASTGIDFRYRRVE